MLADHPRTVFVEMGLIDVIRLHVPAQHVGEAPPGRESATCGSPVENRLRRCLAMPSLCIFVGFDEIRMSREPFGYRRIAAMHKRHIATPHQRLISPF